jgi:hypothetical protein
MKVKLSCEHIICKECLLNSALRLLIRRQPYEYLFFCSRRKKLLGFKSLSLDCCCEWVDLGRKIKVKKDNARCDNKHGLNKRDICLINDKSSYKLVKSILAICPIQRTNKQLINLYMERLKSMSLVAVIEGLKEVELSKFEIWMPFVDVTVAASLGKELAKMKELTIYGFRKERDTSITILKQLENSKTLTKLILKSVKAGTSLDELIKKNKSIKETLH